MRHVRASFVVAVALSGFLAMANTDCSLDGLAGGDADGGSADVDATAGPLDASQQAKDAPADSITDVGADSEPDYADQNHPAGDGAAFPDGGHECYVNPTDHWLYCANGDSDKYNDRNIFADKYIDSGIVNKFVHN